MMIMKIKKQKGAKTFVIKWGYKFEDYESVLEANQLENEINLLEKIFIEV